MSELSKALELANRVHADQTDKRGEPYILHPLRVMLTFEDHTLRVIALLHDVIEDSATNPDQLLSMGFRQEIVQAVVALSRRTGEDYFEYVQRVMANPPAKAVKQADLLDNLETSRSLPASQENIRRQEKYQKALEIIKAGR